MQQRLGKFRVETFTAEESAGYGGSGAATATAETTDILVPGLSRKLTYEGGHGAKGWIDQAEQLFQPGQLVTVIVTDEA